MENPITATADGLGLNPAFDPGTPVPVSDGRDDAIAELRARVSDLEEMLKTVCGHIGITVAVVREY